MSTLYPYNPSYGQRIQGELGTDPVDMSFLAHYQKAPAATGAATIHAAITLPDSGTLDVTTGITNPDVPRTLTITGNQAGITGNVVIEGTDAAGAAITDTIAANGTNTVEGVRAFKTVTKITVPTKAGPGDAISVGTGKKLGLPHKVYNTACLLVKLFDGSADTGTLAVNAELSKNLFALNGTPNGAKVVDLFYIV